MVRIDGITKKYGKTTLFRIMTQLISSNGGTMTADDGKKSLSIGYLPQKFGAFRTLTAREQLLYFAKLKQRKHDGIQWEQEVDRALELTNLTDEKDKKCGKLSGGMVRRLGIAQAILGKPEQRHKHQINSGVCVSVHEPERFFLNGEIASSVSPLTFQSAVQKRSYLPESFVPLRRCVIADSPVFFDQHFRFYA